MKLVGGRMSFLNAKKTMESFPQKNSATENSKDKTIKTLALFNATLSKEFLLIKTFVS